MERKRGAEITDVDIAPPCATVVSGELRYYNHGDGGHGQQVLQCGATHCGNFCSC